MSGALGDALFVHIGARTRFGVRCFAEPSFCHPATLGYQIGLREAARVVTRLPEPVEPPDIFFVNDLMGLVAHIERFWKTRPKGLAMREVDDAETRSFHLALVGRVPIHVSNSGATHFGIRTQAPILSFNVQVF